MKVLLLLALLVLPETATATTPLEASEWTFAGPTTYVSAFDDAKHTSLPSSGAVQNLVQSPSGRWFLGSVNGGVWRTDSLTSHAFGYYEDEDGMLESHSFSPNWIPVLDGQERVECTSISALHASTIQPGTIYAGCGGSTSSEQGRDWNVVNSGEWGGILVSRDDGNSWEMFPGFPPNYYVTDILELSKDYPKPILLVAAQSHLWDKDQGGIWKSIDGGQTFRQVSKIPTFNLYLRTKYDPSYDAFYPTFIVATHARNRKRLLSVSDDYGDTFENGGTAQDDLAPRAIPFYTCYTRLGNGYEILAALTRLPGLGNHTDSQFFFRRDNSCSQCGWSAFPQPMAMDQDGMPKDRMAVMADPQVDDLFYVAGNAGALAWRVNVTTKEWTKLWGDTETVDGSMPHGDCRNFAWDHVDQRLLLVTDGGVFARKLPRQPVGKGSSPKWISLNGNYASLELLSAKYDPHGGRLVMGAQDNCAIITKKDAQSVNIGYGFVFGDGAVTLVDASPGAVARTGGSRLFGTTQFLGVGVVERDPERRRLHQAEDDDEEGCGGLCFVQGERFVEVPVQDHFAEASSFPYFVHPYTLNVQDPRKLVIWTNGTEARPSAFYQYFINYLVRDKDDIGPPTKLQESPPGEYVLDFVSGGYSSKHPNESAIPDPDLIVAVTNKHLHVSSPVHGEFLHPLPVEFALPIGLDYDADGNRILGPLTHARTVHMAVSQSDSRFVAVTGWQTIDRNPSPEHESVFVTLDAGANWWDVTGNLREAAGVKGLLRPGGLEWIDLEVGDGLHSKRALLVGTSTGVFCTVVQGNTTTAAPQLWVRLGSRATFPLVLVADIDHEPISDTLVVATFGRGVYTLPNVTKALYDLESSMFDPLDHLESLMVEISVHDATAHHRSINTMVDHVIRVQYNFDIIRWVVILTAIAFVVIHVCKSSFRSNRKGQSRK